MNDRLDNALVAQGLAPSRERAKSYIMSGIVYVDGQKAVKAGDKVKEGAHIEIRGNTLQYVSRGGLKLEKALHCFDLDLNHKVCVDVGASTGGFTDCMLQNGAAKVYAVDVGYGQLAWKLRQDARVVNLERTNIRHLELSLLTDPIDFASIDVAFISLKLVLPVVYAFLEDEGQVVALIKPQFEAQRADVGKKGVIRDADVHKRVVKACVLNALELGFGLLGLDFSPIKGPEGNIEFLMHLKKGVGMPFDQDAVDALVSRAHKEAD